MLLETSRIHKIFASGDMLKIALWLHDQGCSLFPLKSRGKEPLTELLPIVDGGKRSWLPYAKERPSHAEIRQWFSGRECNLALVTGSVSKILVLDLDSDTAREWCRTHIPTELEPRLVWQSTGKGTHLLFQYPEGLTLKNSASRVAQGLDVRAEGGYIVFCPSVHENGKRYELHLPKDKSGYFEWLPELPESVLKLLVAPQQANTQDFGEQDQLVINDGQRNDTMASLAGSLMAQGVMPQDALSAMQVINQQACKPPLKQREVATIARSIASEQSKNHPFAVNIGGFYRWLELQGDKIFCTKDVFTDLSCNENSKQIIITQIDILVKKGILEQVGDRAGHYRKADKTLKEIDLNSNEGKPINLILPFGLNNNVQLCEKNIIMVAGESNAGKTAFLLNILAMNRRDFYIHYFSNEMTAGELKLRLKNFKINIGEVGKTCKFYDRQEDFDDVIIPDGVNIVDFLELSDKFYSVGEKLKRIYERLTTGLVIVAIQKNKGADFGIGGAFTIHKCRLALSLFCHGFLPNGIVGSCKVVKSKNVIEGRNPEGREYFYQLENGWRFNRDIPFLNTQAKMYFSEKERKNLLKKIEQYCTERQNVKMEGENGVF